MKIAAIAAPGDRPGPFSAMAVRPRPLANSVVKILAAAGTKHGTGAGGPDQGVGRATVRRQDFNAEEPEGGTGALGEPHDIGGGDAALT